MRIVGGAFKGRSLLEFKGNEVRPTADMTRESLFNIIKDKVASADFLDLFCGTGAVGIEALSRGAKSVTFNDISKESLALCKKNLIKVDKENLAKQGVNVNFYNYDAESFVKNAKVKYDVIFIDAPYVSSFGVNALKFCASILNDSGIVVFESENFIEGEFLGLVKYDQRKYGRAKLTFFCKE